MKAVKKNWFDEEHILRSLITTLIGFATAALLWIYFKPPFGKNIVRLNTDERVVALTFDDGPESTLYGSAA